jgi:FMN phosphatase YigB (HAD superfamily)
VQRLALFDLDNTLVDLDQAFGLWAGEFAEQHELGPEAMGWLLELDRASYPHREEFFTRVREHYPCAAGCGWPTAAPRSRRRGSSTPKA